ncbi:hypothetical protein QVD99_002923 [Batrachochytrium dendrobatidis]|nr:hypothetical protein QVD99_002923 [Batrachochytrium dendrobatidis]
MTKFYIQYKNNSPVSVFTQNLHVPEGEEPDISDLVAASRLPALLLTNPLSIL